MEYPKECNLYSQADMDNAIRNSILQLSKKSIVTDNNGEILEGIFYIPPPFFSIVEKDEHLISFPRLILKRITKEQPIILEYKSFN